MGSVLCCFLLNDHEDSDDDSTGRPSFRFNSFRPPFFNMYGAFSRRGEMNTLPDQEAESVTSTAVDNTLAATDGSPPRPLQYDIGYFHSRQNISVTQQEKGTGCIHVDSELLRRDIVHRGPENFSRAKKGSHFETKGCSSESSLDVLVEEAGIEVEKFDLSTEEEDDCPICLEEYKPENPKIFLQCSHHYHLGCIYEWMERSACCPICIKVMVFEE